MLDRRQLLTGLLGAVLGIALFTVGMARFSGPPQPLGRGRLFRFTR